MKEFKKRSAGTGGCSAAAATATRSSFLSPGCPLVLLRGFLRLRCMQGALLWPNSCSSSLPFEVQDFHFHFKAVPLSLFDTLRVVFCSRLRDACTEAECQPVRSLCTQLLRCCFECLLPTLFSFFLIRILPCGANVSSGL